MGKRVFYSEKQQRIVEKEGCAVRIHWSEAMLSYLKRHYATTKNDDLVEYLGVSKRTMIRKARELGLEKDHEWFAQVSRENLGIALVACRAMGWPSKFKKGVRTHHNGEFQKGHKFSGELEEKRIAAIKRYFLRNPQKVKDRANKAAATRKMRSQNV